MKTGRFPGGRLVLIGLVSAVALTTGSAVGLAACAAQVGQPEVDGQVADTGMVRTYRAPAETVVTGLLSSLVAAERMEPTTDPQVRMLLDQLASSGTARINTRSIDVPRASLAALVDTADQQFVGSAGGRYTLAIDLTSAAADNVDVRVRAIIVAAAGGGPLGGRPLSSNGTLETSVFEGLESALASS